MENGGYSQRICIRLIGRPMQGNERNTHPLQTLADKTGVRDDQGKNDEGLGKE